MSTDRKKSKRRFPRVERIKIVEYGLITLVVLAFIGLAIYYGSCRSASKGSDAQAPVSSVSTVSPKPTDDRSIRGMYIFTALSNAEFTVTFREAGLYDVVSKDGVSFVMRMRSDDKSIKVLSFETLLSADMEEDTETARILNAQNKQTLDAMQKLFDCIMPVFRRNISDSDTIVKQCQKVVKGNETYSKNLTDYTVRITSDPEAIPETVLVELLRNAK